MEEQKKDQSKSPGEFTMLTLLLRLVVILRHANGDASVHGFSENAAITHDPERQLKKLDPDFTPLEAVSAVLVKDHEVIAACYQGKGQVNLTVLADSGGVPQDSQHRGGDKNNPVYIEDQSDDLCFPTKVFERNSTIPLTISALANPHSREGKANAPCHNLRVVNKGRDYWPDIKEDPLCCIAKDR